MTLRSRPTSKPTPQKSKDAAAPTRSARIATGGTRHLKWDDIEDWRKDNNHIHSGYHVSTNSWRAAWLSLLGRPHNESVNIGSHLLGALVAAGVFLYTYKHLALPAMFGKHPHWSLKTAPSTTLPYLLYPFKSQHIPANYLDSLAFASFYLSAFICFGCSATFHTSLCHSEVVSKRYHKLDYVGISTYYAALFYAFYCQPILQIVYCLGVTAFAATTSFFVLSPGYTTAAYRRTRTSLFIGLGLSGVGPVLHCIATRGLMYCRQVFALDWIAIGGVCYIIGAVLYAERIPERLRPGKHDIYGSSHQIFHVMCLFAALSHYIALCKAFEYRHYIAKGC